MLNKYYNLDDATIIFKRDNGETDDFSVEDVLDKSFSYNFVDNSKSKNMRPELGLKVSKSVIIKNIKIK